MTPLISFLRIGQRHVGAGASRITILIDVGSWMNQQLPQLIGALRQQRGHSVRWIHQPTQQAPRDMWLLRICGRLISQRLRPKTFNLVFHQNLLPNRPGLGSDELAGPYRIQISLLEATPTLDSRPANLQHIMKLQGAKLVEERLALKARATASLFVAWFDLYTVVIIGRKRLGQGDVSPYQWRSLTEIKQTHLSPTLLV